MSKAYISNVKNGKLPPSEKFLSALYESSSQDNQKQPEYLSLFLKSREAMGCSSKTIEFCQDRLGQFVQKVDYLKARTSTIDKYLTSIPANAIGLATRHASYRAIKRFYRWRNHEHGLPDPISGIKAPILGKPIIPVLNESLVHQLIEAVDSIRDKAIIALFVESGLRLSELANIGPDDINWTGRCIKVLGKGRKVAYAPFGDQSYNYMTAWIGEHKPTGTIWGIAADDIATMLKRLEAKIGITCNPHTFRLTFAVLLRKAGIDTMTIKELGSWENLEMVQRYTRSFSFQDSMKFYKSLLA